MRSDHARWLMIPLALLAASLHAASVPPIKPNILLIVGDDIGWGDIGCYGSTQIQTPNIDRLAKEGMRFTSGYVTAALCSPSRAAILTGRYQQRNGLENNRLAETQNRGLDLNLKTLADVLGGAGYATGLVGKWHLGVGENKEYIPTRRGFQEFFGFYSYETSYTPSSLIRGEKPVKETRRSSVAFAEEACAFIDRHGDKPFFLEVAFNAAHTPLEGARKDIVAARFSKITDPNFTNSPVNDGKRRNFCALVTELDDEIGRILGKLKEKGLDEKTLVIYTSDNGGWISQGGNNGPLRGGKWGIYEGGQRVPFIWRWPGVLPAGKEYVEPVSTLDFMPTFAALAGTLPAKDIDGLNVLPFLRGEKEGAPHGDLFWKLNGQCAVVRDQWKAVRFKGSGKAELYELRHDMGEKQNVAGENPEMVNQLNKAWDDWDAALPPAYIPVKPDGRNSTSAGHQAMRSLGQPFWRTKVMENEPLLFIQEEGKPVASGKLLFVPIAKPTVSAPDLVTKYVEGKDYLWKPDSDTIELTAGSRIPFKTAAQMVPPPGSPNTLMGVLFSEGRFFHDLQVQVTYQHDGIRLFQDSPQPRLLISSLAKLKAKQPLKLVALGDSITEGYNASGFKPTAAPPYQPSYPQLVANTLQERFGSPVTLTNFGRAGTGAEWGLGMVAKVAAEKPDLVILAFGMNHGEPAPAFEAVMRKLRDAVQAACPHADIVLVAPMTGNPRSFPAQRFIGYRDALRNLTAPNVVLADVTSPWLELLKRKPFSDLSGNNINHPNDFGHRLYAEVICQLLPLAAESSSSGVKESE